MRASRRLGLVPAFVLALAATATPSATTAVVAGYDLELPIGLAVAGTVTNSNGDPVAGASVGICRAPDDCFTRDTQTAADGRWTLRGIDPGTYYVVAMPPEGANLLKVTYGGRPGGTTDPALAEPVEVTDDVSGLALAMPAGLRITGEVRNPEGDPVAGVSMYPSCDTNAGSSIASAPDGAYQVVGLPPGSTCQLQVAPPGGSDFPRGYASGRTVQPDYGGTQYQVADADLTGQDITLVQGRTISGHLTGTPGGVSVSAIGDWGSDEFAAEANGDFAVRALWPGTYRLLFTPTQVAPFDSQFPCGLYDGDGVPLAPQDAPGVAVDVTADDVAGLAPVLLVLPSISGTVRDAVGPVAGAVVTMCNDVVGCAVVTAAADGTYRALNLPFAGFVITAGARRHVQAWVTEGGSTIHEASATPVVVAGKNVTGVDLLLPLGGSFHGVITGPSGEPVVGALVFAAPVSGGISMLGPGGDETDANGAYDLSGLVAGDYRLSVTPALNSGYLGGYWSTTGFTSDPAGATLVHVAGDVTAPTAAAPKVSYTAGVQVAPPTVPVHVGWTGSDAGTGIDHYAVQQSTNSGAWLTVAAPRTPSLERNLAPSSSTTYRFRVRAFDKAGNVSTWSTGATFRVLATQQSSSAVSYRGTWPTATTASASGGSYRWARYAGASASFVFTGRAVGWVAVKAPGFGKANVYVDGKYTRTIDLYAASTAYRRIVFSTTWSSSGRHSIRVVCMATAGRPKIDLDAFVVLR